MKRKRTAKKAAVRKKSVVREVFGGIFYFVAVFVCIWLAAGYAGEHIQAAGESMYPTLNDGDDLIIDKLSYRFTNPGRFDLVVFPFRYREDTLYIRRIIGLPGETVQIQDGMIYINSRELDEDYGYGKISNPGLALEPVTLGRDEYLVLGDNRNSSSDSREPSVGNISRSDIIGKVWLRIRPLSGFGFL